PRDAVQLVSPRLCELLREPCAETHLHVGARVPFALLWAARMRDIASEPVIPFRHGSGRPPFGTAEALRLPLLAAASGRLLLAAFLWRRAETGEQTTFREFIAGHIGDMAARVPWGLGEQAARDGLLGALDHLWSGEWADRSPRAGG